jgi:SAM-dependent methyltransferase
MVPVNPPSHGAISAPSAWVRRFAPMVKAGGTVLDLACGRGRHALFFAGRGHRVEAVDRDPEAIAGLAACESVTALCADIEAGHWPYDGRSFDAVVVTNYLHRPLFPLLMAGLAPGGVLIYETFAQGNEKYGRPSNPDFLLRQGELLQVVGNARVLAYEDLIVEYPKPAALQRICAVCLR